MSNENFNEIVLSKAEMIVVAKSMGIALGDYARTPKKEIKQLILASDIQEINHHLNLCIENGSIVIGDDTNEVTDSNELDQAMALLEIMKSTKGIDEQAVRKIVKAELSNSDTRKIEIIRPDLTTHKIDGHVRPEFESILRKASVGVNILLIGSAGCGKTHLAHQVATALGKSFASVSCTAGMSESALQGWLLPAEGGAFEYMPSDFVTQYENGGVFLFDEIDAADPNTLLFVNQALANGGFNLPIRKGNTYVKRHAEFVCMGAANTFGTGANMTYAGRERLDESTLDRFRAGQVKLDYDTEFERKVCDERLYAWAMDVRKGIQNSRLNRVMSTRFLMDATKLMQVGESLQDIKNTYFIGWKAEEIAKV